ncbi:hypothetical protein CDCA_CDCA16G4273 [Cyanidium caldarium]|uniref:Nudix hydrolase domain-containing protein n=1 Tax=Cyanidium caldarium TaxID=2771 RepID=A0AAV9J2H7_CYACA|nr:hypothetical protein CDCA_CDCA16G4273 [Cyanidium caldarium]
MQRIRGGTNRGPIVLNLDEVEYLLDQLPPPPEATHLRERLSSLLTSLRQGRPSSSSHDADGYRVPSLTVDAAVLRGPRESLEILLVRRGNEPFRGKLAFPGGFVEYGEDPEAAVLRELHEECGVRACHPRLVAVRGNPRRDPRKHTCTICYHVELVDAPESVRGGDDAASAGWYAMDALLQGKEGEERMAFDHHAMLGQLAEWLDRQHAR